MLTKEEQALEDYLVDGDKSLPLKEREAVVREYFPDVVFDYSVLKPNPESVTRGVRVTDKNDPELAHAVAARFRDSSCKVCWSVRSNGSRPADVIVHPDK